MTGLRRLVGRRSRNRAAQREFAIFAVAYLIYFGVRALPSAMSATAFHNAARR